uniref:Integron gene cassette protein n=1 Tax=Macrostomum lignano TaxID=282301 RepID=A0A1I8FP51_9PLAT
SSAKNEVRNTNFKDPRAAKLFGNNLCLLATNCPRAAFAVSRAASPGQQLKMRRGCWTRAAFRLSPQQPKFIRFCRKSRDSKLRIRPETIRSRAGTHHEDHDGPVSFPRLLSLRSEIKLKAVFGSQPRKKTSMTTSSMMMICGTLPRVFATVLAQRSRPVATVVQPGWDIAFSSRSLFDAPDLQASDWGRRSDGWTMPASGRFC